MQRWIRPHRDVPDLVGLTALLVGGVWVATRSRNYLDGKRATIATLNCLGAPGTLIMRIYFAQIMILAVIGVAAGMAIGAIVPAIAGPLVASEIGVAVRNRALSRAAAAGRRLRPAHRDRVFRCGRSHARARSRRPLAVPRLGGAGAALAAPRLHRDDRARDRGAGGAHRRQRDRQAARRRLRGRGRGDLRAVPRRGWAIAGRRAAVRGLRRPGLRLAFANMHRPGSPTGGIVMSLGIGLTVLVVITQVHGNFARELREQIPAIAPTSSSSTSMPDQVAAFDQIMRTTPGVRHMQRVPSLRARITAQRRAGRDRERPAWCALGDRLRPRPHLRGRPRPKAAASSPARGGRLTTAARR